MLMYEVSLLKINELGDVVDYLEGIDGIDYYVFYNEADRVIFIYFNNNLSFIEKGIIVNKIRRFIPSRKYNEFTYLNQKLNFDGLILSE